MLTNWKTTLTGLVAIGTALFGALQHPDSINLTALIAQIAAGVGLIGAKDHNVTGGTKEQ